ncbi:hypothetical protein ACI6Q5_16485 [Xanthomonas codiaei]|uniref:Restriction endonuclease n=1 Tax=Xanthomonas codiaei TaxID=56463 RepID=A0A2S7CS79_9XANT|nr:hypothetical protein [Xanthomonas codiaei]PPU64360.1 hypothetical protein XcodCFBP4690_09350 [Xanthomonas codiaei]
MSAATLTELGKQGEDAMNAWLKLHGFSYVAICQALDTFAPLFGNAVKRPDFLLLLESIGLIAIDVKNYVQFKHANQCYYSLPYENELKRAVAFERLFRIPVWYAYFNREDAGQSFYWISALKALEVGEIKPARDDGPAFLSIGLEDCEHLHNGADIARLYTHRLPSVSNLSALMVPRTAAGA